MSGLASLLSDERNGDEPGKGLNKVSWPAQDLEFHPLGLTFRSEEKEREKDWNPGTHGFGSIPLPGEEGFFPGSASEPPSPGRGERQAIE